MATIMSQNARPAFATRSSIQKVCIVLGVAFIVVGLAGIFMPGFMSMHLSMAHNFIHLATGALALGMGYSDNAKKTYTFAVAFGVLFGLMGIAGFVIGQPGYPGVGHMAADQNLLRVVPNVLEFGTMDHAVHIIFSAAFLLSAYAWKKSHYEADRSLVDVQRRAVKEGVVGKGTIQSYETFDSSNGASDLSKSELGKSDISPVTDKQRRTDFESRI